MKVWILQRTTDHYEDQQIEILGLFTSQAFALVEMQKDNAENTNYQITQHSTHEAGNHDRAAGMLQYIDHDFDYFNVETNYRNKDYGYYRLMEYEVQE